jgi:molybdate transport system ATP-binding protein
VSDHAPRPHAEAALLDLRFELASKPDRAFSLSVEFAVPAGITVLCGASGAGKTTTLLVIAGLLRPDQGRIALGPVCLFDSERAVNVPVHERRVGVVFQSLALFPHLSAEANVAYGLPRGLTKAERRCRARDWLQRLRVSHVAERRPDTFSGGESQRVALARALAVEPSLLLLDEPLSALDGALKAELKNELRAVVAALAVPTLLVTHDPADALELGERAIRLAGGRALPAGDVRDVLATA